MFHRGVELAGSTFDTIHVVVVVGRGSRHARLDQLTAEAAGLPVVTGPVEATALGNVVVDVGAGGAAPESLGAKRADVVAPTASRRDDP